MTQPAIKVEGLYKEYVVGHAQERHGTFYDLLSNTLKAPFQRLRNLGGQSAEAARFWALRDVNFEVQPGEVVGVIGRNGAGKSTLLKVLSRITAPTKGRIEVRGRLASLLEVGTGFHPELSGRENIFLNGAILGMSRSEVARKFDEIVAFAEVEKFIDTPVKRYSSGMYVRLAFGVAAHLEADILIVDEVLAVGDFDFQRKCLGKMQDISGEGRTVLFVSHNMAAIHLLCGSVILLENGTARRKGPADSIINEYKNNNNNIGVIEKQSGSIDLLEVDAKYFETAACEAEISIDFTFAARRDIEDLFIDFGLENEEGLRYFQIVPEARGTRPVSVLAGTRPMFSVKINTTAIASGDYFATIYAHSRSHGTMLHQTNIKLFNVIPQKYAPECTSSGFTAVLIPKYQANIYAG